MVVKLTGRGTSGAESANSPVSPPNFAQTCGKAAELMANARKALDSESLDAGQALTHLDDAIACLQSLSTRRVKPEAPAGNTIVAFQPANERRSA